MFCSITLDSGRFLSCVRKTEFRMLHIVKEPFNLTEKDTTGRLHHDWKAREKKNPRILICRIVCNLLYTAIVLLTSAYAEACLYFDKIEHCLRPNKFHAWDFYVFFSWICLLISMFLRNSFFFSLTNDVLQFFKAWF